MQNAVCFIGHRKVEEKTVTEREVKILAEKLIEKGFNKFIFGDRSEFNDMCYKIVTEKRKCFPKIQRIHFGTNYENADEYTEKFLKIGYEDSICPKGISKAGKSVYIQRNFAMIDESEICVFYYDGGILKSGTATAFKYASNKNKKIINLW